MSKDLSAPPPSGAQRCDPWETSSTGAKFRFFETAPRGSNATVSICGFQRADGSVYDLTATVDAEDPLSPESVAQLISDLSATLADIRRLRGEEMGDP